MTIYCDDPLRRKTVSSLARNAIVNSILQELEKTVLSSRDNEPLLKVKKQIDAIPNIVTNGKMLVAQEQVNNELNRFKIDQMVTIDNLTSILDFIVASETPRPKTPAHKIGKVFNLDGSPVKDSRYTTYTSDGRPAIQMDAKLSYSCGDVHCDSCWWKTICEREGSYKLTKNVERVIQDAEQKISSTRIMVSADQVESNRKAQMDLTKRFNVAMKRMTLALDGKETPKELMSESEKRDYIREHRNTVDGVNYG